MRPYVTLSQRNSGKQVIVFVDAVATMHEYMDFTEKFTSISITGGSPPFSVRESLVDVLAAMQAAQQP